MHEQSRRDRDEFIKILWQNVKEGYAAQFRSGMGLDVPRGVPYDYSSVMHYGAEVRAFRFHEVYLL